MRYFFEISYKGTAYHGWQKQKNAVSVQQIIEEHLSTYFRTLVDITGSGRTDTGVHAFQQYFHLDLPKRIRIDDVRGRMNSFLPNDISIQHIRAVHEDAHARFDAKLRKYEYWITTQKDPFNHDFAYQFSLPLSLSLMNEAARILQGRHDFECFSRVKTDVKNFVCEVKNARWEQNGNMLKFHISADRFLRGMVRAVVGTLLEVGQGKRSTDQIKELIKNKDRKQAGMSVPAKGLYLAEVIYPESIFI